MAEDGLCIARIMAVGSIFVGELRKTSPRVIADVLSMLSEEAMDVMERRVAVLCVD